MLFRSGVAAAVIAAVVLWLTRKKRSLPGHSWLARAVLVALPVVPLLPLAANTFGWIFTETARQPWLAFGLFFTADGVSPGLTSAEVLASLIGFGVLYGVLAVIWTRLVLHLARLDLSPDPEAPDPGADDPAGSPNRTGAPIAPSY